MLVRPTLHRKTRRRRGRQACWCGHWLGSDQCRANDAHFDAFA